MTVPQRRQEPRTTPNPNIDVLKRALREHSCLEDFQSLVDAQCSEEWLMYAVSSIRLAFQHHARLQDDPDRMDSRKLKTLLERTRWVARQWEQQFQRPFGKEIVRLAGRNSFAGEEELLKTPARLLSLARWARDIHWGSARHRRPLYDDRLARLVEYVKFKTGKYHDREVSALVAFAIERDSYDETTLRTWKSEHPQALRRARLHLAQKH